MNADASRCASVVKGHAAAEGSSEKGTADTLARTDGPANELPETIRGGLEVTIRMASRSMKTWNWSYLHKTAEQQVRFHKTNRSWALSGFVAGCEFIANIYSMAHRNHHNSEMQEEIRGILNAFTSGPAQHSMSRVMHQVPGLGSSDE